MSVLPIASMLLSLGQVLPAAGAASLHGASPRLIVAANAAFGQAAAAPTPPQPRGAAPARAARPVLDVEVTDRSGGPVQGARVVLTGVVEREGTTGDDGRVRFTNLRAGAYRLRVEHDGHVTLERDLSLAAASKAVQADVALTPAPPPPTPPAPAPAEAPDRPTDTTRPVGEARVVQVPEFAERNFIGRNEPQKLSVLGCTGYTTTRLLQLRDPIDDRVNEDADDTLYVIAGDAVVRIDGSDRPLAAGALVVVPRGTKHSLSRRGRNPAILLSTLSGPPCTEAVR